MQDLDSLEDLALKELHRYKYPEKFKEEPPPPPKKKKSHAGAFLFLALACIVGVEAMACRYFEPELYEKIAAPVRQAAQTAWDGVYRAGSAAAGRVGDAAAVLSEKAEDARDSFRAWVDELTAPKEEEPTEMEAPSEEDSALAEPELAPPKDILDPLISDLVVRDDGLEYLTGGGVDVIYFNQTDESRAEQTYGSDPLSTHGCGPTAMAMAVSSLTGTTVEPEEMARVCVEQGYWCRHHGSYLSIVPGIADTYGLTCEVIDPAGIDEDELALRLSMGDVAVALMTKGHFTRGGHFILLRGVTLAGEILVADPASRQRSLIPWDLPLIVEELSPSRSSGSPLWLLSKSGGE